ncbi:hypothetical protein Tco_0183342 [Tanacetum coccineum]
MYNCKIVSSNEASLGKQEDASKQGRKIANIDADVEITLVDETQGRYGDEYMFGVHDLDGDEVVFESKFIDKAGEKRNIVEKSVDVTDAVTIRVSAARITNVELILAQTLAELKSAKTQTIGVLYQIQVNHSNNILYYYHHRIRVKFPKDKGLQRESSTSRIKHIALDDITSKDNLTINYSGVAGTKEQQDRQLKKIYLFQQLVGEKKKILDNKKSKRKRGIGHQQELNKGVIFVTYLKKKQKIMGSRDGKPKDLKNKFFANIQELFKKAMKRPRIEKAKKQKVDDDQEAAKMKELMKNFPDEEEVAVDGRIVGIKRLLDDLEVTAAQLMLLVYKLLLLVFRVNVASTKLQLPKD